MTGNSSRRKGIKAELDVANYLKANGFPYAERRGTGFEASDLIGTPDLSWEIKDQARIQLAPWFDQMLNQQTVDRTEHGLLVIKRRGHRNPGDWYCVTTLNQTVGLLRAVGYGKPI